MIYFCIPLAFRFSCFLPSYFKYLFFWLQFLSQVPTTEVRYCDLGVTKKIIITSSIEHYAEDVSANFSVSTKLQELFVANAISRNFPQKINSEVAYSLVNRLQATFSPLMSGAVGFSAVRIQLFISMRIRIQGAKPMRIHPDPDPSQTLQ